MGRMYRASVFACFLWALGATGVEATTMTFTGVDLFNDPNVSFPTVIPTLGGPSGTSLIFGPGTNLNEKLLVLPLLPAGSLSGSMPETISLSINLTRLPSIIFQSGVDHDPHLLLGDGSNLVGALIFDNVGGGFHLTTLVDSGNVGIDRISFVGDPPLSNFGYPAIGESFDINVDFTLQTGLTTIDVSFLSGVGSISDSFRALNLTSAIDFVFMGDESGNEQYQINSLTVTTPGVVPEPSTLLLLGSGLAGLAGWRWRTVQRG